MNERKLFLGVKVAGRTIQEYFGRTEDFAWLQTQPLPVAFQHLAFRYRNLVYSVMVGFMGGSNGSVEADGQMLANQKKVAVENHLIPSLFLVNEDSLEPVLASGSFPLLSTGVLDGNHQDISPANCNTDAKTKMSLWEIHDYGISLAKEEILKQGGTVKSYCNVLGIGPQIWFEDKDGKLSFCYVATKATYDQREESEITASKEMKAKYASFIAYRMDVELCSTQGMESPLYRGDGFYVKTEGLKPFDFSSVKEKTAYVVRDVLPKEDECGYEKRREAVKKAAQKKGDALDDRILDLNTRIYETIGELLENKLTTEEMYFAQDFLSDLILNRFPSKALTSSQDRIAVQIRFMEDIPWTKGKLTDEEKELFAFCVFHGTCVEIFDEKKKRIVCGYEDLKDASKVRVLMEEDKLRHPERYSYRMAKKNEDKALSEDFGYTLENPILATSIAAAYRYLRSICLSDGRQFSLDGHKACRGKSGIVDGYFLKVDDGRVITLYIDSYAAENSESLPKGFAKIP